MNPDRDLIVAIDIGGSRLSAGLMTLRGDLIDRTQVPVDQGLNDGELFESLVGIVDDMLVRADEHHQMNPLAIGVGCVGPIGADVETVSPVNLEAWRNFPLRERLEDAVSLPVYGGLDATSLALAEGWLGAAQGRSSFLAVVVSGSIAGGVVLDGQLLEGASGNAGHIGHVVVEPNGRRCSCGARGCLDAEASGRAIEVITGRPPTEPSYEIMQRTGELVGRAVASACNLLDLDLAVVGGPVALGFGATFFNAAQAALDRHSRAEYTRGARITPARLGDRGPLIGAGAVGLRGLRRQGLRAVPPRRSLTPTGQLEVLEGLAALERQLDGDDLHGADVADVPTDVHEVLPGRSGPSDASGPTGRDGTPSGPRTRPPSDPTGSSPAGGTHRPLGEHPHHG
ncbi:MAG: ROK family protein [Acidimicrobiales bacterium]